jgi:CBS-domain-containing membrane protein
VPVVDADGNPLGIVTEGDLIRRLADAPPGPLGWFLGLFKDSEPMIRRYAKAHGKTARDVMTPGLVSVGEDASAEDIARLMEQHHVRRVPVLRDGKLAGLVSRADLLRALLRPTAAAAVPDSGTQDDRAILRAVIKVMREQPWTDTFWVFPDVQGGEVTFYGFARSGTMREGLKILAGDIPGVRKVVDRLSPMPAFLRITG